MDRIAETFGIPIEALQYELGGFPRPASGLGADASTAADLGLRTHVTITDRFDSVPGGVRLQVKTEPSGLPCTMWVPARRQAAEDTVFLTASHCTTTFAGTDTDSAFQNTTSAGDLLGREYQDPQQPCGPKCRGSDAALFEYLDDDRIHHGRVARTSSGLDLEHWPDSLFAVHAAWPPYPSDGDSVYLSGQKTGRSKVEVVDTCVDVDKWPDPDVDYTLECQDFTDIAGDRGDSGAPVFYWGGSESDETWVDVVGIWIGARDTSDPDSVGIFSALDGIMADFGTLLIMGSEIGPLSVVPREAELRDKR